MSDLTGWIDPDPVFGHRLTGPHRWSIVCISGPERWLGHRPVLLMDLDYCNEPHPTQPRVACGLVRGHAGEHLAAAVGVLTGIGPIGIEAIR